MISKLTLTWCLVAICLTSPLFAQSDFKTLPPANPAAEQLRAEGIRFNPDLLGSSRFARSTRGVKFRFDLDRLHAGRLPTTPGVVLRTDPATGTVIQATGRPLDLAVTPADAKDAVNFLSAVGQDLGLEDPKREIRFGAIQLDSLGQAHLRLHQVYQGLPVEPADAYLHAHSADGGFDEYFGRLQGTPTGIVTTPGLDVGTVERAAVSSFGTSWKELSTKQLAVLGEDQLSSELVIYYREGSPLLTYRLDLHPNLASHITRYVDARTGAIVHEISHVCGMAGLDAALPPETARVRDLNGDMVTINTFSQQGRFFLFDVTRAMFRTDAEGEAQGVIQSFDAAGQSPLNDDFDAQTGSSGDNRDWSRTAASVHHNAGVAYSHFLDRFQRNSIDGLGGTVYSFYNVNNEDGTEMDNAFFSGRAMFYGNGDRGFIDLPRSLDVAGHELTHGVIRATANLVYELQPGAINESMADVFGYMIEGESGDYRIGEDIVNRQLFASGTMRDMRNPNNGGTGFGSRGWQPAHVDEFVELPNDDDNDHGGVHVNSGIPNRAFYLFATSGGIGDDRAERVYYRALSTYLTRNSQFLDLRIAVARAAADLYGESAERAANEAFAAVGIGPDPDQGGGGTTGGGTPTDGGDYENDLPTNPGERFLLLTDSDLSALYLATEEGNIIENPYAEVAISSKPSITDDGTLAVFVDSENQIRFLDLTTGELSYVEDDPSGLWRNIVISRDGRRMAITTTAQINTIIIGDLVTGQAERMRLTNPTSAQGINIDNVLYPDVMEWEHGGEMLMYDALNELDDGVEYWDINFLRAWNDDADDFGDGAITKLYDQLEAGTSIGNPTFAKNSPYIIAFDRQNGSGLNASYSVMAANLERGEASVIWNNPTLGVPNFGVGDDRLVFDGENQDGEAVLAEIMLREDKITAVEDGAFVMIPGGRWGVHYGAGDRSLNTSIDGSVVEDDRIQVYPTVSSSQVTVSRPAGLETTGVISLFDMQGRRLATQAFSGGTTRISLRNLAAGSYLLSVPTAGGVVVRRVIRQ